ncbi:MAG: hypothetical protein KDK78_09975 [Chlamydiia bacterium]|nr:hypothetical protein [Chlamydiia bacterium]
MARDEGKEIKRRMSAQRPPRERYTTLDAFAAWDELVKKEEERDWQVPKEEFMETDYWGEAAEALRRNGLPEDVKQKMRENLNPWGQEKLMQAFSSARETLSGKEIPKEMWPKEPLRDKVAFLKKKPKPPTEGEEEA